MPSTGSAMTQTQIRRPSVSETEMTWLSMKCLLPVSSGCVLHALLVLHITRVRVRQFLVSHDED